ncbi:MAG: hypothetical protein ACKPCK_16505, partial [Dolichospermum sp.]
QGNRELLTGKRFWTTLLFVTYVGFFRSPTCTSQLVTNISYFTSLKSIIDVFSPRGAEALRVRVRVKV